MSLLNQVPGPYEDTTCQMVVAYGNPSHRHLEVIRDFRDSVLKSFSLGRKTVDLYYRFTPFVAKMAKRSETARLLVLLFSALPAYIISRIALRAVKV